MIAGYPGLISPTVGGIRASRVLPSADGASALATNAAARDFVTDAYAHAKFIGYAADATALLQATGCSEQSTPA